MTRRRETEGRSELTALQVLSRDNKAVSFKVDLGEGGADDEAGWFESVCENAWYVLIH